MSIEPFFDTKIYIEKGTLICSFISNGKELTELRGLLFIKEMTAIMEKISTIKLNRVVFPDPFGPIIPVIDPFLILREQLFTAAKPPKYFDKLLISKIFSDINYLFSLL